MVMAAGMFAMVTCKGEGCGRHRAITTAAVMDSRNWGSRMDTKRALTEGALNYFCYRLNASVCLSFLMI